MLNQATATVNASQQKSIYRQLYTYLSDKSYGPLIFMLVLWNVSVPSVHGPGISTLNGAGISTILLSPNWAAVWKS
jgi:hypothetical protein